jgi:hypothetical protein
MNPAPTSGLLRLPFLNQAVQGDESTLLGAAAHAQVDPLHQDRRVFVRISCWRNRETKGWRQKPE